MKSTNFCLSTEGADVILATSNDEKYPPENIIDGRSETFWTTTGLFPQEFIISLHKCVMISKLTIQCYLDLEYKEGELQIEEFSFPEFQATHLRFIILSAFDTFVSVHRIIAEGIVQDI
ncbi:intraflagellar transport protein 25 homolog isoform X2 [Sphaerodactylus townsendi]|uniref:intraflagellar transport protein 25 homolog isoform X2 n=1 Tax=Sphaerodactylus townsendi TaxID=933632 RepID=UPI0020267297|nr:intraflagellar transport protein 25 homolog isoform X2 [Sphaerodactylus townsendi]